MLGLTVLVVDRSAQSRAQLVGALRRMGLLALGTYVPTDAVALLDGLATDVVMVRAPDDEVALAYLRNRTVLIRLTEDDSIEDAIVALLRAIGHPDHHAPSN